MNLLEEPREGRTVKDEDLDSTPGMGVIVSVTQNAIERDSRAYKIASSFTRFGYDSVAVEVESSALDRGRLPFSLITVPPAAVAAAAANADQNGGAPAGNGDRPEPASRNGDHPDPAESAEELPPAAQPPPPSLILLAASRLFAFLPKGVRDWLRPRVAPHLEQLLPGLNRRLPRLMEPWHVLLHAIRTNMRVLRAAPPADVYYMHYFGHFPAAFLLARRHRARLIYDAHDATFEPDPSLFASFKNPRTLQMLEWIDRRFSRSADTFITVSDGVSGLFERSYGRRPRVVRNYHDFRLDCECPNDVRSAAGVPEDAFLLVMTGATKAGDTVEQALEALQRLPSHVHLALVGKGHELRRQAIDSRGLGDRVHAIEPVPPTQVASFIRSADASPILYKPLSENYRYALPNRFFHAVAAGLPIIYPRALPEIAARCERHDMGIPMESTDPASIEAGVRRLLEDDELRARLGANARAARDELGWEGEERVLSGLVLETCRAG